MGLAATRWTLIEAVTAISIAIIAIIFGASVRAASDDAWEAFREEVEAGCLKAAEPMFEEAAATVDAFGSESYGLALVRGKAEGADADIAAICVFDKRTKAVEIGGELPVGIDTQ